MFTQLLKLNWECSRYNPSSSSGEQVATGGRGSFAPSPTQNMPGHQKWESSVWDHLVTAHRAPWLPIDILYHHYPVGSVHVHQLTGLPLPRESLRDTD